jgi:hypothetical protein
MNPLRLCLFLLVFALNLLSFLPSAAAIEGKTLPPSPPPSAAAKPVYVSLRLCFFALNIFFPAIEPEIA